MSKYGNYTKKMRILNCFYHTKKMQWKFKVRTQNLQRTVVYAKLLAVASIHDLCVSTLEEFFSDIGNGGKIWAKFLLLVQSGRI